MLIVIYILAFREILGLLGSLEAKMHNLTTREGLAAHMEAAKSEQDWNDRCDAVKEANGGDYPNFWWDTIMMSGLASRVSANWR